MKILLLILIAIVSINNISAQESMFNHGDKIVNFAFGFSSPLYSGDRYSQTLQPLSASIEIGVIDNVFDVEKLNFGVGGYACIASARYERPWVGILKSGWDYTYTIIGFRGLLHYPLVDNLDSYGGLMISYNSISSNSFGDTTGLTVSEGGTKLTTVFGGRYYFTPKIAGLLELGFGISNFNIGVSVKL